MKCFVFALILLAIPHECFCLTVKGIPAWLEGAVSRSLTAVWREIPNDGRTDREGTLAVVAHRLFAGYRAEVKPEASEVIFTPEGSFITPEVKVKIPDLRPMSYAWFSNDIDGMPEKISRTASEIPQEALTWADESLREKTAAIVSEHLPGWEFTHQIYISDSSTVINISFRPSSNMILALKPEINSRTIPAMFRSDLEARLIPELSALIGLPVKWAEKHNHDIEHEARKFLEDRHAVENLQANVITVKFKADKISRIEAAADSKNIMFSVWVSAYAGLEDKYPEAGAFFGFRPLWRINDRYNFAPEFYTEILFALDDFGFTQRFGGRFELLNNFWAGIEYEIPDDEFYARFEYIPIKIRRPYARWRHSLNSGKYEGGLGYRIDEHISAEIYFNGSIGLRGIWNL